MDSTNGALALREVNVIRPAVKDLLGQKIKEFQQEEEKLRREEKRKELERRLFEIRNGVSVDFYSIYRTHFKRPEYPTRDGVVYEMHFEHFSDEELLIIAEFIFYRADKDQLRALSDFKLLYSEKKVFEKEILEIIKDLYRRPLDVHLAGFSFKLLEDIARSHWEPAIMAHFKERTREFRKIEFKEITLPGLRKQIKNSADDIWRHQTGTRPEFMQELSDDELLEYVKIISDAGCKKTSWRDFLFGKARIISEKYLVKIPSFKETLEEIRAHFPKEADFNWELITALRGKEG